MPSTNTHRIEKIPPSAKSETGPAALIAMRRLRGSNHASEVSTNAYGKITTSLKPARWIRRPNEAIASPCAVSCTATTAKRPIRKMSAPSPTRCATTNGVP